MVAMKRVISLVFLFVAVLCSAAVEPPASKADAVNRATFQLLGFGDVERIELPAARMGTGPHDFYSLFAKLPLRTDAVYGVGIATSNKFPPNSTRVVSEGLGNVKVEAGQQIPAGFFQKVDYLEITFGREQLERASRAGAKLRLSNGKSSVQFAIPNWMFAALTEAADKKDYGRQAKANQAKRKQEEKEARDLYIKDHPEVSDRIRQAIAEGSIVLGMTKEDTRASWGDPSHVNKTVNASGISEQWVYGNTYVYFENGRLTSWQSSE
jgi:hypothetical protein